VKFHDGTDFNADAVKFNLDRFINGSTKTTLKQVTSVVVVDDYTIRLNLSTYEVGFLNNLSGLSTAMVSPTAIQTHERAGY
jgi:peptide/nickel transport system substrate-binding protein